MHRDSDDYLDEICFWQCAHSRLVQHMALLREQALDTPGFSREPLHELLRRCGLEGLCHCPADPRRTWPLSTGERPRPPLRNKD